MTREELKTHCEKQIENCEMWATYKGEEPHGKVYEEHKLILELLEQEPRKGHWISHREHCEMNNLRPSGLGSYFWCSNCDCGIDSKNFARVNYNYCPNCGADMKEVEE